MSDVALSNLEGDLNERLRLRASLAQPLHDSRADLKKLAADIRALSAGHRHTPSEYLLRESRDQR